MLCPGLHHCPVSCRYPEIVKTQAHAVHADLLNIPYVPLIVAPGLGVLLGQTVGSPWGLFSTACWPGSWVKTPMVLPFTIKLHILTWQHDCHEATKS